MKSVQEMLRPRLPNFLVQEKMSPPLGVQLPQEAKGGGKPRGSGVGLGRAGCGSALG